MSKRSAKKAPNPAAISTEKAIEVLGGHKPAAAFFGVSFQAVYQWGETLPPLRAWQLANHLEPAELARLKP